MTTPSVLQVRPEELRQAARVLRGASVQVEDAAARCLQLGLPGEGWAGLAAWEQQARVASLRELVALSTRPGRSVAAALDRAVDVAGSAGDRVRTGVRRMEECRDELLSLRTLGPPPDPLLEQLWRGRLHDLEHDLLRARCLVEEAEREWLSVARDVAAVVSAAWSVVTELDRARRVLQPVLQSVARTWTTVRAAGLTTATVTALARARWQRSQHARQLALLRARAWFRQLTVGGAERGGRWSVGRAARVVPGPAGWVLTYLGAVEEVRTGGGYPGRRGDLTRALAAGALVGGPLVLAGILLPPAGLAGIAAVSAYQAWTAGNLVYDNRAVLTRYAGRAAGLAAEAVGHQERLRTRAQERLRGALPRLRGRLPSIAQLRDRLRQAGAPLRLPSVPLPPRLPPVVLGGWAGPPPRVP